MYLSYTSINEGYTERLQISKTKATSQIADFYRPRTLYNGRLCLHWCVSVQLSAGGGGVSHPADDRRVPHPRSGREVPQPADGGGGSYPIPGLDGKGGTTSQVWTGEGGILSGDWMGGVPLGTPWSRLDMLPPGQDWMGYPWIRTGWGTPQPGLDGVPP